LIDSGTISGKMGKDLLGQAVASGKAPQDLVAEQGLSQVTGEDQLRAWVNQVVSENRKSVQDFNAGKKQALGFLVGQVMKLSEGRANPERVNALLGDRLTLLRYMMPRPGDKEAIPPLTALADRLRSGGNWFAAGYVMDKASHAAFGDVSQVEACLKQSFDDFKASLEGSDRCSLQALASLHKLAQLAWHPLADRGDENLVGLGRQLVRELAERIRECFADSPDADAYLARSFIIETDLLGAFTARFPEWEPVWGTETSDGNFKVQIHMASAFHLFIYLADYYGAQLVVDRIPQAFVTPRLRGWKAAVRGLLSPDVASEAFREAAQAFSEDTPPKQMEPGQSWTSTGTTLWAPYFKARANVAQAALDPSRVEQLISEAASTLRWEEVNWAEPTVRRFALLIGALASFLKAESPEKISEVRDNFSKEVKWSGTRPDDPLIDRFLTLATEAFDGFRVDPVGELRSGRLRRAMDILDRIPLFGPGFSAAVEPAVTATQAFGGVKTWMYDALERIKDEKELQRLLLRLFRASLPIYAQILHGPLEYGKDIVVLLEEDGRRTLKMYQVKAGDITTAVWKEASRELEKMFQVPLSSFQLSSEPEPLRRGFLIYNGHANPNVQPWMKGWLEEQRRDHSRSIQFLDIDYVVRWVVNDRLVTEFKEGLSDLGLYPRLPS
jgi:hypothetical protein